MFILDRQEVSPPQNSHHIKLNQNLTSLGKFAHLSKKVCVEIPQDRHPFISAKAIFIRR